MFDDERTRVGERAQSIGPKKKKKKKGNLPPQAAFMDQSSGQ
jgi:hypothetical protein